MRLGSTHKVLAKCMPKYDGVSLCSMPCCIAGPAPSVHTADASAPACSSPKATANAAIDAIYSFRSHGTNPNLIDMLLVLHQSETGQAFWRVVKQLQGVVWQHN